MNKGNRHIYGKSQDAVDNSAWKGFDDDIVFSNDEQTLFGEISNYMRALSDMEEVMKDPEIENTRAGVRELIAEYSGKVSDKTNNSRFIREAVAGVVADQKTESDIHEIKQEIRQSNINDLSADWVEDWNSRKQGQLVPDREEEERKKYISGALKEVTSVSDEGTHQPNESGIGRLRLIRYIALSAAALLGVFILIRTLLPSSDPLKIFDSYYIPFEAISPATRSTNHFGGEAYATAIKNYSSGDYTSAAAGFSEASAKDPSFGSPSFFLGVTQLALGNYKQSVENLVAAVNGAGEYEKEAQWYLGLAYLKTGEKLKAAGCFEKLSESPGYYRERSEKILRRLK